MATTDLTSSTAEGPVDRAFRVLQTVVAADAPIGVRELGRRTGLPRSTASRLVGTLERLRMLDRTPDGDVIPGGALATLQIDNTTTPLLRDRVQPLLVDLVHRFGENAALAIDDGDAMLYISNVSGENAVSVGNVAGERHAFHLVAPGLVTMASWSAKRLAAHLDQPLEPATEMSMTKPTALRKRMKQIRQDGYAWTDQELDIGISGLAVPIFPGEEPTAVISLYGPAYRFSPETHPQLGTELTKIVHNRLNIS